MHVMYLCKLDFLLCAARCLGGVTYTQGGSVCRSVQHGASFIFNYGDLLVVMVLVVEEDEMSDLLLVLSSLDSPETGSRLCNSNAARPRCTRCFYFLFSATSCVLVPGLTFSKFRHISFN